MTLPVRDFQRIGPIEGERFPDVRLPDQTGAVIDLHHARGGRPALVVFYRSAEWWPFCKTQLVELQRGLPTLATRDVALFAISYDSVAILRGFATEHGISFLLLSDEGSDVIRRLGLLNERVQEDHAVYGVQPNPRHLGVPYPGVFVLDERGIVVRKRFHERYRERDTGSGLIADTLEGLGVAPVIDEPQSTHPVRIRASLDSPTFAWFQRLRLTIEVVTAPGVDVYGHPAPPGVVPLTVSVAPIGGLEVGPTTWPPPLHRVPGTPEEVAVHTGTIRGSLPLTFTAPPGQGDQIVQVSVAYQTCRDSSTLPASSIHFDLPVQERALIGRVLPAERKTWRRWRVASRQHIPQG